MGYWKNGEFCTRRGREGFILDDDRTIRIMSDDPILSLSVRDGGLSFSHFDPEHDLVWAVHADEVFFGDGTAPGYDKEVIEIAREDIEGCLRFGQDFGPLIHVQETPFPKRYLTTDVGHMRLLRRRRKGPRLMIDVERRILNLRRTGKEYLYWPRPLEIWRENSTGQYFQVRSLSGNGITTCVNWESLVDQGSTSADEWIFSHHLVSPEEGDPYPKSTIFPGTNPIVSPGLDSTFYAPTGPKVAR